MVGPARQAILNSFAEQTQAERAYLVRLIAQETGKPLWETMTEVAISLRSLKVQGGKFSEPLWPDNFPRTYRMVISCPFCSPAVLWCSSPGHRRLQSPNG